MRHLFDQYSQPENKLTHALASSLAQDQKLLRKFVGWSVGKNIQRKEKFHITEQSYPGQEEMDEQESERRGLPDAWIYTDDGWALLIESKVASGISIDQLNRHARMARRRGYSKFKLLVINVDSKEKKLPKGVFIKSWQDVYEWGMKETIDSKWANHFTSYLEIAEAKMVQEEYLTEGMLTKFTGIPFNDDRPYTYFEAKRLLSLMISELKSDRIFIKKMGINPRLESRSAITGRGGRSVWDFLRPAKSRGVFTSYPHFTIAIGAEAALALVTLPNGVKRSIRRKVLGHGFERFNEIVLRVANNMKKVFQVDPNIKPYLKIVQRHYKTQRSSAIEDAVLKYDLRTIFQMRNKNGVKVQPEYIRATYEILKKRRSNIQLEIGVEFPYQRSTVISTPSATELYKASFIALKPFVEEAFKAGG